VPSPPPRTLTILARFVRTEQSAQFKISFTGEPGRQYDIQFTDALPLNWQSAQKITADAQGNIEFTDDTVKTRTARFFRVVSQ
jgi:hypothetical protein